MVRYHRSHLSVCNMSLTFICSYKINLYRSDPTENDSVEGLRPNARGPGLVTFGVCMLLFSAEVVN